MTFIGQKTRPRQPGRAGHSEEADLESGTREKLHPPAAEELGAGSPRPVLP